jgi:hypothetical protein
MFAYNQEAQTRAAIVRALETMGQLTLKQLQLHTGIGSRSLSYALNSLRNDRSLAQLVIHKGTTREKVVWSFPELPKDVEDTVRSRGRRTETGAVRVETTLPAYLYELIRAEAVDERRSFSAQMTVMLESVLKVPEKRR